MKKIAALLLFASSIQISMAQLKYPKTKTVDQTDDYHGTKINDPYRWLENDTSAETAKWVDSQIAYTNEYLQEIPYRNELLKEMKALSNYAKLTSPFINKNLLFFYTNTGLQNQSVLRVSNSGDTAKSTVLIDPNKLSADGTVALQAVSPSENNKYFAYSVSASGSDWQEIQVLDLATKKKIADKISNVKFSKLEWNGDDGFYYSGYAKPKDEKTKFSAKTEFQKIYYHKIGTPQSADKIIYQDLKHPLRYVSASLSNDKRFLILDIAEGTDGTEIKVKDFRANKDFVTVVPGFANNVSVLGTDGNDLIVRTNFKAPNYHVMRIDARKPFDGEGKILIEADKNNLEEADIAGNKLIARYLKDATSIVKQFSLDGKLENVLELPQNGTITLSGTKSSEVEFFLSYTSYTVSPTLYRYSVKKMKPSVLAKAAVEFNQDDYTTVQEFYTSKDGTSVPMFITYRKGMAKNGNNPTMLYGYGGFNVNITPGFNATLIPFLNKGGILAVSNLRGGGEYGEDWHKAGMLSHKQTVFDDFIAGAEYLIKEKYASASTLAIRGGSNGGLLVGAAMTQRPDLFKVAIPQVGVLDMLRYHKFTVGWGWVVEYGSSDNADDLKYLLKYSPLHNVKQTCYPATLVTTADHDDRVVPAHSFKFAATLQKNQTCDNPILIRIDKKAGHGAGKPITKQLEEMADIYGFTLWNILGK